MKLVIKSEVVFAAVVLTILSVATSSVTGCGHDNNNNGRLSDEQYKKSFPKPGDPPPAGYEQWAKQNANPGTPQTIPGPPPGMKPAQ
jgi:hypothetical protein